MTPYLVAFGLFAFAAASLGGQHVGRRLLGACLVANAGALALAGAAVSALEPNFGPDVVAPSVLLVLAGLGIGTLGLFHASSLAHRTELPEGRRALATVYGIALVFLLALASLSTVRARGRPTAAPDLAPLVLSGPLEEQSEFAGGGMHIRGTARKVNPTSYWPDTCFLVITDDADGRTYDVDIGRPDVLSGHAFCPRVGELTIDPSRRILYRKSKAMLTNVEDAWSFPGLEPVRATVWTCRSGRLLAVPTAWIVAAWISLGVASLAGLFALQVGRACRRRFAGAREARHAGNGHVRWADTDERALVPSAADLPVGPLTILGAVEPAIEGYRTAPTVHGGTVFASSLADQMGPQVRREAFGYALGLLALSLGAVSLLVAALARLV